MVFYQENIPSELKGVNRWLSWHLEDRNGKKAKIPRAPWSTGHDKAADYTKVENQIDFDAALTWLNENDSGWEGRNDRGLGFVFMDEDPFVGVDLDDCIDEGSLNAQARKIAAALNSYTEYSPSTKGIHIIVKTKNKELLASIKNSDANVEIYCQKRYFTMTGNHVEGYPNEVVDATYAMRGIYNTFKIQKKKVNNKEMKNDKKKCLVSESKVNKLSDEEIICRALSSKDGLFNVLWNGDMGGYQSHSEADLALLGKLAFWTGKDEAQMERLFAQSGLYREKWDREDYRRSTIRRALDGCTNVYSGRNRSLPPANEDRTWALVRQAFINARDSESSTTMNQAIYYAALSVLNQDTYISYEDNENDILFYGSEFGIYGCRGTTRIKTVLAKELQEEATTRVIREIINHVRNNTFTSRDKMGPQPGMLPVRNGLLDLKTMKLKEYSPDDRITWKIPTAYDPNADCPKFKELLGQILPNNEAPMYERDTLQEISGYPLHHWSMPFHTAVIFVGTGANGKSQFLSALVYTLGEPNITTHSLFNLANGRFYLADLYGTLANIHGDLDQGILKNTGIFKQLVGGDVIKGEQKHKNPFFFTNTAKMLFSAQRTPKVTDESYAFWRRWILIEFPTSIPKDKRIPHIGEKIAQEEGPGILNWMLEGYHRLMKNGRFSYDLEPGELEEKWKNWGDSFEQFASSYLKESPEDYLPTEDVYGEYKKYCKERGDPISDKGWLTRSLKKILHIKVDKRGGRGQQVPVYNGITWSDEMGEELISPKEVKQSTLIEKNDVVSTNVTSKESKEDESKNRSPIETLGHNYDQIEELPELSLEDIESVTDEELARIRKPLIKE